jgi:hypothetical protein
MLIAVTSMAALVRSKLGERRRQKNAGVKKKAPYKAESIMANA